MSASSRSWLFFLLGPNFLDQRDGFVHAVKRDEGAHARTRLLPEQYLIERQEPGPQFREYRVALAHLIDRGLDFLGGIVGKPSFRAAMIRRRYTELLKRCHPDVNGGDRSAEHKLQRVIKAFRTLQKAKLV